MVAFAVAMAEQNDPILGYFPEAELVLALVYPLGTQHTGLEGTIKDYLDQFGYKTNIIRLSNYFPVLLRRLGQKWKTPKGSARLAHYKIDAGNRIRRLTKSKDILAREAAGLIHGWRDKVGGAQGQDSGDEYERGMQPRTAHLILSLKRPEEADTLRRIYGDGFFLIGLSPSKEDRDAYFRQKGMSEDEASLLIDIDAAEVEEFGQQTRKTFHLSDVFLTTENYQSEVPRFLDLLFGCHRITPTLEEHAMFLAYATSLRSGDLSRQVGAVVVDGNGELISVGYNEVPKFGGGLYGPEDDSDARDLVRKYDANDITKNRLVKSILRELGRKGLTIERTKRKLETTGLMDITEFGRAVHAEMEALLACIRTGRSTRRSTLYTTTFPCHNCCRHIIAAGIKKVVYVEPYPKSKAASLHSDAISVDEINETKISFMPFIGIGPRRYFDLFSLKLSTGYTIERKEKGRLKAWQRLDAPPRLQMQPNTYLARERLAFESLNNLLSKREAHINARNKNG